MPLNTIERALVDGFQMSHSGFFSTMYDDEDIHRERRWIAQHTRFEPMAENTCPFCGGPRIGVTCENEWCTAPQVGYNMSFDELELRTIAGSLDEFRTTANTSYITNLSNGFNRGEITSMGSNWYVSH